jgi:hypothetical protein
MESKLVDYLLYEPEDNGILWIKLNRPERMNALVGTAEENSTVAKVGEYMHDRLSCPGKGQRRNGHISLDACREGSISFAVSNKCDDNSHEQSLATYCYS